MLTRNLQIAAREAKRRNAKYQIEALRSLSRTVMALNSKGLLDQATDIMGGVIEETGEDGMEIDGAEAAAPEQDRV